ncbi:uncharacterized protein [Melopsittacus undulatus]|uniref:uncharacterized protein n=1 Tax=Melopsittacus undulatus TaxID=13146 RepID=UPI001469D250|nr:uncharacterized protein LOC117437884 [Melopsittacus undulatus]
MTSLPPTMPFGRSSLPPGAHREYEAAMAALGAEPEPEVVTSSPPPPELIRDPHFRLQAEAAVTPGFMAAILGPGSMGQLAAMLDGEREDKMAAGSEGATASKMAAPMAELTADKMAAPREKGEQAEVRVTWCTLCPKMAATVKRQGHKMAAPIVRPVSKMATPMERPVFKMAAPIDPPPFKMAAPMIDPTPNMAQPTASGDTIKMAAMALTLTQHGGPHGDTQDGGSH